MTKAHQTYQIRGHVKAYAHDQLRSVLAECATLYNAALQERRDAYRVAGRSIGYRDQYKSLTEIRGDISDWDALSVQIGRGVLLRVDRAFKSFFRRVKVGGSPGYPRFRSRQRYTCIEIAEPTPGMVKVEPNRLRANVLIRGLPKIQLRLSRQLPSSQSLKSLRVNVKSTGVYVDLVYQVEKEPLPKSEASVGLDMGVSDRITLSTGETIPRRITNNGRKRRLQRMVSRSRKGSNRRVKRVRMLAKESHRSKMSNRNECHRITSDLIYRFGRIAVENLTTQNMTRSAKGTIESPGKNVSQKSGLNREILNQTWGVIRQQLTYKAEWAGRELVEVDPKYTSRTCSRCGVVDSSSRRGKLFDCTHCYFQADADWNAAENILQRAFGSTGVGMTPSRTVSPEVVKPALAGLA
jgi:putative transposase